VIEAKSLSRRVYEHLLPLILTGELAPGRSLREGKLAAELGVSRTPIREALHRLAEYGVVEIRPNYGAVVRRLGIPELVDFHQIREALEGLAAELAAGRLTEADFRRLEALAGSSSDPNSRGYFEAFDRYDTELHTMVAARSGNPLLAREIVKLHGLTMLIHDQLEATLTDKRQLPAREKIEIRTMCWGQHAQIVEALRDGDPAESRRMMVEHLRAACQYKTRLFPSLAPSDPQGRGAGPRAGAAAKARG
jgi:DNA-binding GntR family transcriptional regulator